MYPLRRLLLVALGVVTLLPGVVRAHELTGRFDAPIPLELLFGGAAVTVAITAVLLAVTVTGTERERPSPRLFVIPPPLAAGLRFAVRALFLTAVALVIVAGLFDRQVPAENFATLFVWAVWLKGVALVSAVAGSPWRVLSPWRTLYAGLARIEGRPIAVLGEYPGWLGAWPALGGFLLWIGVLENLTAVPRSPRLTALFVTGYTLTMLAGGLAFGPRWFRQADALAVLYRLFGRVAPVHLVSTDEGGYRVSLRPPWRGCTRPVAGLAVTAFVIATVYTVSFDGFTSTPEFQTLLFGTRTAFGADSGLLLYLAGFVGFCVVFLGVVAVTQRLAGEHASAWRDAAMAFAPTVLPIAVAYEIAHNYPSVLGNVGQLPVGLWTLAGSGHGPTIDLLAWLSVPAYWWSQVLLIVAGHVVAVIAAHYVTLTRYPSGGTARRGHAPLTVLMVGYTVVSLWIVSRPIVTG